ncbi:hypothetical protein JAAARDRAFT_63062 [Jaapia argillacea MUCL 33604]|uniref:Extracellular membrane protein CFEM domain-containing protein n=1 Tax=Jaapia argillacea MUCL 33604 TaxID=933084 RepID=A0A067PHR2_9AGAM|nr:hypothetical protein JAAARDRAFT_63062 [Jaapia argillacea MUCL 33604]
MYGFHHLLFTLLALIVFVRGIPTSRSAIVLQSCSHDPNSNQTGFPASCLSDCRPIMDAQQICDSNAVCTCQHASSEAVMACLRCSVGLYEADRVDQVMFMLSPKIQAYSQVCGDSFEPLEHPDPLNSRASQSISTREPSRPRSYCLFGFPEIVSLSEEGTRFSWVSSLSRVAAFLSCAAYCFKQFSDARRRRLCLQTTTTQC